jgi:hypothetical protein
MNQTTPTIASKPTEAGRDLEQILPTQSSEGTSLASTLNSDLQCLEP